MCKRVGGGHLYKYKYIHIHRHIAYWHNFQKAEHLSDFVWFLYPLLSHLVRVQEVSWHWIRYSFFWYVMGFLWWMCHLNPLKYSVELQSVLYDVLNITIALHLAIFTSKIRGTTSCSCIVYFVCVCVCELCFICVCLWTVVLIGTQYSYSGQLLYSVPPLS